MMSDKLRYLIAFQICLIVSLFAFWNVSFLQAQEDSFDLRGPVSVDDEPLIPSEDETIPLSEPSAPQNVEQPIIPPEGQTEKQPTLAIPIESTESTESKEGELITVNFENVDIKDVIRILADKAQLNMVVGPDVTATVNLQLTNITWEKALDIILKTYNLTYKRDGELIRIMTLEQMQLENEKVPLFTKIVTLNFARAGEIKGNFANMLSSRGRIDVNDRTNSLIITDIPDNIATIEEIANKLDTRTPQVMIEALMVDILLTQKDELGINWSLALETGGTSSGTERSVVQSLGALASNQIAFGTTILTDKDLDAVIGFLQEQKRVIVLAHPKIMTLDNLAAKINLTEEVPYQQQSQSTTSGEAIATTSFKESGINLAVTPHVTTKDNYIYLNIDVKQSILAGFVGPDDQPQVDTRSAATNLLVRNKETAVIGGLRKKNDSFTVSKLPLLGDIPIVGAAFRKRKGDITDTDLMIFVTPTIVQDVILTEKEQERFDMGVVETPDWEKKFDKIRKKKSPQKISTKIAPDQGSAGAVKPGSYFYLRPPQLKKATE